MVPLAAIRSCRLFRGFTDTGIQILWGIGVQKTFPKGTPLFTENETGDTMLVIVSGTVALSTKLSNGTDAAVGEAGETEALGELSLLQRTKRLCTATAVTDVAAVEFQHEEFQRLMSQKPQACVKLLMNIVSQFGQRVVESRDQLKTLLEKNGTKR